MPAVLSGSFGGDALTDLRKEIQMKNDLTEGSLLKKMILFALPVLGANLLQAMYGTVDLMIVGLFTEAAEVSAVSTGSMSMYTITGIVAGITMGCTILMGHNIGRKDYPAAARAIKSGFFLFVIAGIIASVIMIVSAPLIAGVMNAPPEAFAQTTAYLRICGGGVILIILFNSLSGIFRGLGDSRTPLLLMIIACVCNIIGDLILVGYFKLGAAGAAAATVGAQGISVLAAALMIRKKGYGFPAEKSDFKVSTPEMKQILRYGLPMAVQEGLSGISFMVILAVLNNFGVIASAGVGVGEKICGLMFVFHMAFMSAVSAFSAQNVGARKYDRARKCLLIGSAITVGIGLVMFAVTFTGGATLARFFTADQEVCLAAGDYLRSYAIDCIIVGVNFSMMGYLNGHGKTLFVSIQGILATFLVRIPYSFLMSRVPGVSLFQVGFATPLATAFAIVVTVIYLIPFEKKLKKREAEEKAE